MNPAGHAKISYRSYLFYPHIETNIIYVLSNSFDLQWHLDKLLDSSYLMRNSHFPLLTTITQIIAANRLVTKDRTGVIFQSSHFLIYPVYITYATQLLGKRHLIFFFCNAKLLLWLCVQIAF